MNSIYNRDKSKNLMKPIVLNKYSIIRKNGGEGSIEHKISIRTNIEHFNNSPEQAPAPLSESEAAVDKLELDVKEIEETVDKLEFNPEQGEYKYGQLIELNHTNKETEIYYTLDGSEPTYKSEKYTTPIVLTKDLRINVRAYNEKGESTPVMVGEFKLKSAEWLSIEPEEKDDPVEHKDFRFEEKNDGWAFLGGSIRGKMHAHRGMWREDAFKWGYTDKFNFIAVSDGAGSCKLSRIGSNLACTIAIESLKKEFSDFTFAETEGNMPVQEDLLLIVSKLKTAAQAAVTAIGAEALKRTVDIKQLSSTLLLTIATQWKEYSLVAGLQVGDGVMAVWEGNEDLKPTILGNADHGERSGETMFLTTNNVENTLGNRVRFTLKKNLNCIAVMTDGISDDYFPEEERIIDLFNNIDEKVLKTEEPKDSLSEWISYNKIDSYDDRTVVLFHRRTKK